LMDRSVRENVSLGLNFRGLAAREMAVRVEPWLERLGLAHLASRPARQLSGGEAQRVSLARAFVLEPDVLLLDEPFTSLDSPTRTRLLEDLKAVLAETSTTSIFITHDLQEALKLASRLAVILHGRLCQVGEPRQVFESPASPEVAAFLGCPYPN
ncbi:MAG TPA: ATP-binding cassette domain-containing protein, partial [Anaerolineales bacterium]